MSRDFRYRSLSPALLFLALSACGAVNSSRLPDMSPGVGRSRDLAADRASLTRTVVLHVTGMMKTRTGLT